MLTSTHVCFVFCKSAIRAGKSTIKVRCIMKSTYFLRTAEPGTREYPDKTAPLFKIAFLSFVVVLEPVRFPCK